jgi:hypothetical protein
MTTMPTADDFYDEGVAHLKRGEYEQAVRSLSESIRLNPDFANAYVGRALAYRSLGSDAAADDDDRAAKSRGGAKPPHGGALVIVTPPIFEVSARIDQAEFHAFVDAVEEEVQRYFRESPAASGIDLNVACALLPSGRLLVDIQLWPAVPTAGLAERIEGLRRPVVRVGPVAFLRCTTVNGGCRQRHDGFRSPFASLARPDGRQSLDELLMAVDCGGASWWDRLRRFFGERP